MSGTAVVSEREAEARAELRRLLPPGSTVHTMLRHVSRSGMMRAISPVVCVDGEPVDLTWLVVRADFGFRMNRRWDGVTVDGCGMDMGFQLVYSLSRALYPDGFECAGGDVGSLGSCPSNDHSNGDRDYSPHHHGDGGYALRHRWL